MTKILAQPEERHCAKEFARERLAAGWSRRELARHRRPDARAALADCQLCEHRCGVNRLADERGLCRAGIRARVFSAQIEVADELELIPTFAIALSGCDLRCAFCITGESSWNPRAGEGFPAEALAAAASAALAEGARTVMILGGEPTVHLPTILEIVEAFPEDARLVWKTNAHATAEARALLDGLFDVWLPDFKFGNDDCARRIARVPNYTRIVQENLRWMAGLRGGVSAERRSNALPEGRWQRSAGVCLNTATRPMSSPSPRSSPHSFLAERGGRSPSFETVSAGTPPRELEHAACDSELIVRHLLLPGHVECCWRPIAAWLAEELPGVKVSLRAEYWPAWQASRHVELRGAIIETERRRAGDIAREFGLNLIA